MDNNRVSENARKLLVNSTSNKLMIESFKEIMPSIKNKNIRTPLCVVIISSIFAFIVGFSDNTVSVIREINTMLNSVIIALFAIIFTGYTFFPSSYKS